MKKKVRGLIYVVAVFGTVVIVDLLFNLFNTAPFPGADALAIFLTGVLGWAWYEFLSKKLKRKSKEPCVQSEP